MAELRLLTHPAPARTDGTCPACSEPIVPGERIGRTGSGWVHAECGEGRWPSKRSRAQKGKLGVPVAESYVFTVRAVLQSGVVLTPPFPSPLDGVLASLSHRDRLGVDYRSIPDFHVDDLPLARWRRGVNNQWVWLASQAHPVDHHGEHIHWWHKRFDHRAAEEVVGDNLPPLVRDSMSRYRGWRMPMPATVCSALEWTVCGDPVRVKQMVDRIPFVGRGRAQGEGAVIRWEVDDGVPPGQDGFDSDSIRRVIWDADGVIGRPFPLRAWNELGLTTEPDSILGALRPPYWRPAQTGEGKAWRPMIAPWTRQ